MEWKTVSIVFMLAITVKSDAMGTESSIENLRRLLTENFSTNRHHIANPVWKNVTRVFLADTFESYGLNVTLHTFPTQMREYTGVNVIGTLPGRYTGTPLDKPVVLGGHYDTMPDTPGVDDNGSGLAALLEAARIITSQPCKLDHTVMFVSFDFEEWQRNAACQVIGCGSRAYVSDILLPYLNESGIPVGNFQGAIILDAVMGYNTSENSQIVPPAIQMLPGQQNWCNSVANDGFRGNFIGIIGRQHYDSHLYAPFLNAWYNATESAGQYKIVNMLLPFRDVYKEGPYDPYWPVYQEFLRSDHASFYKENPDLKAVHLTDTGEFRGRMQQCYHQECDNIQAVTEEQLGFLKKITDTATVAVLALAGASDNCTDTTSPVPPIGTTTSKVPSSGTTTSAATSAVPPSGTATSAGPTGVTMASTTPPSDPTTSAPTSAAPPSGSFALQATFLVTAVFAFLVG